MIELMGFVFEVKISLGSVPDRQQWKSLIFPYDRLNSVHFWCTRPIAVTWQIINMEELQIRNLSTGKIYT